MTKQHALTIYYDNLCKVCSYEINHYKKQKGADLIRFVDICSTDFDAIKENVDPLAIHKIMHARWTDGTLITKVDAFIAIWSVLPKYALLARLARLKPIRLILDISYSVFTYIRPWLPRYSKSFDCSDSPYCEVKHVKNTRSL